MTARLLDGSAVAADIRRRLKEELETLAPTGIVPRLEVILVGDDPASAVYVGGKAKACAEVGIRSTTHHLSAQTSAAELGDLIARLNGDDDVDGILLQLPLPDHLDARGFLDRIDPAKDVDGFHPVNVGLLHQGRPGFVPCTPAGIVEMFATEGIDVSGKRAVVIGRSDIVGKPMAALLMARNATVTVCHSRTRDLGAVCREADILVAAVGRPATVTRDFVKQGAVVVDVGMNRIDDRALLERLYPGDEKRARGFAKRGSSLVGDVEFTAVREVASAITPVPGGVGPLTIAGLLTNTAWAARRRRQA